MVDLQPILQQLIEVVIAKPYGVKVGDLPAYQSVRKADSRYQGRLVLALATMMRECVQRQDYSTRYTVGELLTNLMRGTPKLSQEEYVHLFRLYGLEFDIIDYEARRMAFWGYPVGLTLIQVAKLTKKQSLGKLLQDYLLQLLEYTNVATTDLKEVAKARVKIQEILQQGAGLEILPTVVFSEADPFGRHLNQFVGKLDQADSLTHSWLTLLQLWQKASGTRPSAKYQKTLDVAAAAIGVEQLGPRVQEWLQVLLSVPVEATERTYNYPNYTYTHTEYLFLQESSLNTVKGLLWTIQPLVNELLLQSIAALAAKCYRKIPGKGPLAAGLGNACLLVLSQNGLPGVAALARVRSKIRQTNTQELIARYIAEESQKLGVTPAEIEDMAAPDFGLKNGRLEEVFGEYTATLTLTDGKADVQWQKTSKALKSVPAALKATHADELKELKAAQTQAQQTYAAQRDRLDRSFVDERRIPWTWFEQYYFQHGLMSLLARPLIWRLHQPDSSHHDALWLDEQWRDAHGQPVPLPSPDTQAQLWHPVLASMEEVLAWRQLLEAHQLRQPLKQAFREVYLLTPPEERTRTYSNRMAAHILKQHQFNSLAKLRGWRYSLLGAYDKGYDSEIASLALPSHNLQAEYWVSEVYADGEWNDTGIYNYVSTDQVRITRDGQPVPLPEVPPLAFSEVMRDVDLFVGVASVGNDPQWRDNGGLAQFRNYWESYSFGELGEVAKSRKLVLERLVPRLKIGRVSEIKGNFLVVRGKRRTYKIHLGSGNILMEPNDQYLCIVPDRSSKNMGAHDVFLPFEGDAVLSIILSKALLLMDDDKITDETILRQL
ncbi:DUF4132 domain-containing protein [Hymenobacter sp. GOD-10R]|uniref:DUF4132 domain-containing protein n=1 Tax=Hymenobacter sp. GOD-10R TaxID=3093922 RepID=UPI002D79AFF7|nr:DUF4132 domain-containing protein [Hymenobacter sp. GOD-10R]WRQ31141.1 DUF4132 domain-containing protein [Hymenobacter sp. GOD-10R]